jgi:hypothetical protein
MHRRGFLQSLPFSLFPILTPSASDGRFALTGWRFMNILPPPNTFLFRVLICVSSMKRFDLRPV